MPTKANPKTGAKSAASITDTFGGSAVSSKSSAESTETTVSLKDAEITVPKSALKDAPGEVKEEKPDYDAFERTNNSFDQRAIDASIGLIRVDGIDFRYVGRAPAHPDENAEAPTGLKISSLNSTFTPLSEVPFDPSIRVKIGDEFFFPQDASSWAEVELNGTPLVPRKADKAHTKARFEASNA